MSSEFCQFGKETLLKLKFCTCNIVTSLSQVLIRSTTPQHFRTPSGTGFYSEIWHEKLSPETKCFLQVPHPIHHPSNHLLLQMARMFRFKFLDNFPLYYGRGDVHFHEPGVVHDCTHHCHTPEIIWPELVLLTQLII